MINYQKLWSLKKVKYSIMFLSLILIYNIYSIIDYKISRVILEDVKLESQKDSLTIKLKEMMQDSVLKWQKNKKRLFSDYNTTFYWYWENIVVFHKEKTKAYSFIYQMDTSKSENKGDYVKYFLAFKKKDRNWYFYTDTPTLAFGNRKYYCKPPYTKEKMQDLMYEDLAKYVSIFRWKVSDDLVEEWFESEGGGAILRDAMKE